MISGLAGKVEDAVNTITIPSTGTSPATPDPTGLDQGSLLRAPAFASAMRRIRGRDIGKLENLRVAPARINATLLTPRTTLVSVQVSPGGRFQQFSESGEGFGGATETIPFDRLERRAPQRLARAAAERLGRPVSRVDYLVPSISDGKITWAVYFRGGAIFLGDARGRVIRRIS